MAGNGEYWEGEESSGTKIQILGTNPDNPTKGRIFVWTKMGWFERLVGQDGDVAFTPIAESEEELRELVSRDNPDTDLGDLRGKYRKIVSEEFIEQSPSYSDSPEDSREESDDDEEQEYKQHD
ncbi:MAG: hypothetical protein ABR886_03145 [Dehalococcoidales bacterium]